MGETGDRVPQKLGVFEPKRLDVRSVEGVLRHSVYQLRRVETREWGLARVLHLPN